ncbi:IclR family transcriptional regulator [Neoaquamicrobium sediminum]|uniref:IclR family transcriptional regulator n=1 Tax=Neoaquamicrobium sediminum TaxID=1849104 RepID=UPI001565CFEA|nr:IclR family transcriptional regulator [Mesorhizobium sediminum]NRC52674.1 IclR family transcriptional regulator [Mesorhizobium sediminum]
MRDTAVGTVERVITLMRALAEAGGDVSIKTLSDRIELPASTVHRLLALLMNVEIVERGKSPHSYRIGVEFYRLSALVFTQTSPRAVARPFLERVAKGCGEVSLLMRYMKGSRKVMLEDSVDSLHPLRYSISLYEPLSVLWGASGRSVLAFLPDDEIRAILAEGEQSPVEALPTPSWEEIQPQVAEIRAKGYAHTTSQKISGAVGFGAPVFESDGSLFGSLCVTVPEVRYEPSMESPIAKLIVEEAAALSATFGYTGVLQPAGKRVQKNG